ncbi:FG-GAP repeat domain-containing protein [Thalassobellus suaedae]|uniref:VCBS repeat-containing protein n=1 Tax=Thalassobellus suaedae TaxID=3074124 RepID=A0ABY9XXK0_9FLAO|nr:VCBS repeat-containing protein [Flavobacteriaceae bacterium HL-DH14]
MKRKLFFLYIVLFVLIISCKKNSKEIPSNDLKQVNELEYSGEELAKMYCVSCHIFTEPKLLDKKTWKYGLLPQMGYRMGIYHNTPRKSLIESGPGGKLVESRGIFPIEPNISEKEWQLINNYFYDNAPDSLIVPKKDLKTSIKGLKVKIPEFHVSPPMVTAIKYNTELNQVYIADAKADFSTINILDKDLKSISTLALPSPISHIDYKKDTIYATLMGGFMPTDAPSGSIIKIFKLPGQTEYKGFSSILKNIQRPVHTTYTDINGDKKEDIIVCEYGNHTGKLSLYLKNNLGKYDKKILSNNPGASSVTVKDLNKDGLLDIISLMAQGNEEINVYYNLGNGEFKFKNLIKFPPCFGSVSFSMIDWNKDGFEDIIYVNGDNADYSMVSKPYHGLRIYLNDGENNFKESFFQHQNGAYKSITHDFDKDGDLDITLTSFFPDLINEPEEGFIYMDNISTKDSIKFNLKTFKQASLGRWLIIEKTDFDKNNFPELLLGSFTGMGINGDSDGKVGKKFMDTSPTIMTLKFD